MDVDNAIRHLEGAEDIESFARRQGYDEEAAELGWDPGDWLDMTEGEIEKQPSAQKVLRNNMMEFNFDSVNWQYLPAKEDLLRIRRHYAANVTMIDEKIGEIINTLENIHDISSFK